MENKQTTEEKGIRDTVQIKKIEEKPNSVLDRYFRLYEHGRKNQKAPQNYIDYFQSRHFLLNEISIAVAEERKRIVEMIEHQAHFSKLAGSKYDGYVYYKDITYLISKDNLQDKEN